MANYHFIAIGGAIMHQLAIQLNRDGHQITGSDDAIYDPALTNLKTEGICPEKMGWDANKITANLDGIILGMHAKPDNIELLKAKALQIPIYSFPEFIALHSKEKQRIVVAGSHGKTTTTAIIMHALRCNNYDFDYLVGAKLKGFKTSVKLSKKAPLIVLEGDEYLSSPIDMRSKFVHYKPHIAIITGIAWDHINVFATLDQYLDTFQQFINSMNESALLVYYENDIQLKKLVINKTKKVSYKAIHAIKSKEGLLEVVNEQKTYPLNIFGQHNLENMAAAQLACESIGITKSDFLSAMTSFQNPAKRLNLVYNNREKKCLVYRDFAHAPSKVMASVNAVKKHYDKHQIIAIFELHTFSSLNSEFLVQYENTLSLADKSIVFLDSNNSKIKEKKISNQEILDGFKSSNVQVVNDAISLLKAIKNLSQNNSVFLFMSSGNFGDLDFKTLFEKE